MDHRIEVCWLQSVLRQSRPASGAPAWLSGRDEGTTEADQRLLSGNPHDGMIGTVQYPAEMVLLCDQGLLCPAIVSF